MSRGLCGDYYFNYKFNTMTLNDVVLIGKKILLGAALAVIPFLIYFLGIWAITLFK